MSANVCKIENYMKKVSLFIFAMVFASLLSGCGNLFGRVFNTASERMQAQEKMDEINELIDNEEYDKAFEECKAIVNSPYVNIDDMNVIVVKFQNENRLEEGLYLLNVLLLRDKNNDSTLNNLSWAYHMLNKNESANFFADRALAISSDSEYQLSNKANALRGLGKSEEALKYYDRALEAAPDFSQAVWGKAMTYNDLKDYEKSLELFIKYREIMPEDEESTRYYITNCYRELNQLSNAIKEYESYFEKDMTDISPLYSIAYIYYEEKSYDKALEYYDKILGIEPEDAWTYYCQADCYAKLDRMDEAMKALKKSIEIDPEYMYEIEYLDEAEKVKKHKDFVTLFQ